MYQSKTTHKFSSLDFLLVTSCSCAISVYLLVRVQLQCSYYVWTGYECTHHHASSLLLLVSYNIITITNQQSLVMTQ